MSSSTVSIGLIIIFRLSISWFNCISLSIDKIFFKLNGPYLVLSILLTWQHKSSLTPICLEIERIYVPVPQVTSIVHSESLFISTNLIFSITTVFALLTISGTTPFRASSYDLIPLNFFAE